MLDCFLLEGWKVLVRVGLAIFQLYLRQVSRDPSMAAQLSTKGLPEAIMRFCQSMTVSAVTLQVICQEFKFIIFGLLCKLIATVVTNLSMQSSSRDVRLLSI